MQKPMLITTITIVTLILTGGGYFGYKYWWQNRAEVVETRDFSCPGMSGFTFKYPVFKGWEAGKTTINNGECNIWLNSDGITKLGFETPIGQRIIISTRPVLLNPDPNDHFSPDLAVRTNKQNLNRIYYDTVIDVKEGVRYQSGLEFYIPISEIAHRAIRISPPNLGFPRDQFFKTVIESFRLSTDYPYKIKVGKSLDEFSEDKTKLEYAGIITINSEHTLTYEANKKYEGLIKEAVDEINPKNSLSIESAPPLGTNFRGSFSRIIEKKENDWALAVEENLEKSYGLIKIENDYKILSELKPVTANDKNALEAVKQELKKNRENENDFYAKIEDAKSFGTNTLVVHLWNKKDYEVSSPVLGNPSGKSRDIYYNSDLKKITKIEFWQ